MEQYTQQEVPEELGVLSFKTPERDKTEIRLDRRTERRIRRQYEREVKRQRVSYIPGPRYDVGGAKRPHNFRGGLGVKGKARRATSFTVASAYPFVASGSLGVPGVCMGSDKSGGGGFFFDPWELYRAKVIKGMAMVVIGSVGQGKSTMVKSLVARLVLAGRRALIMSDKKGEWGIVADFLGGKTITVGPGIGNRINPLEEGQRPSTDSQGRPMTDRTWTTMIRSRRLSLLRGIVQILLDRRISVSEDKAIRESLDAAVAQAASEQRVPVITDVMAHLRNPDPELISEQRSKDAYGEMSDAMSRMVEGDLEGMFDGESTVELDATAPIIVFNTQALEGVSEEARKITYACTQSWAEAVVTSRDFGQRVMVYEEGLDALSDPGSLQRMVAQWKLARAYGIFNVLVLHKLKDLNMAGDEGTKTREQALSLLGDSDIRVVYHQNTDQMVETREALGLTVRECEKVGGFREGYGLWKLGDASFVVQNIMTGPERPIFNTDKQMDVAEPTEAEPSPT